MGPTVNFEHEHMESLGLKEPPKAGMKIRLHGEGHVMSSGSHMIDGQPRHHMVVQLHKTKMKKAGAGERLYGAEGKAEVDAGSGE